MLTVKQIKMNGMEVIESGIIAERYPASENTQESSFERIKLIKQDGSVTDFTGGTVFVMNDLGKTVARYDLGASPVPL